MMIIVTGASSGIGDATWRLFSSKGYTVVGIARRGDRLAKTCTELRGLGHDVYWYQCDLSDCKATLEISETILENHGCPDAIVFNAGVSVNKLFAENSYSDRLSEINLNFLSPSWMLDIFLPEAKKRGFGHFIAVGSLAANTSFPGNATYAASKAATAALWQSLSHEYRGFGVAFSTVLPGLVDTEMTQDLSSFLPRRGPDSVAQLIFRTFQEPGMSKTNGFENKTVLAMSRVFPRITQDLVFRLQTLIVPKQVKK